MQANVKAIIAYAVKRSWRIIITLHIVNTLELFVHSRVSEGGGVSVSGGVSVGVVVISGSVGYSKPLQ